MGQKTHGGTEADVIPATAAKITEPIPLINATQSSRRSRRKPQGRLRSAIVQIPCGMCLPGGRRESAFASAPGRPSRGSAGRPDPDMLRLALTGANGRWCLKWWDELQSHA